MRCKMNQQGVDWLKMAHTVSKMAEIGQKWGIFKKILECMWCGYSKLSQEMSDKMKNESGQFYYMELRKRQKCGKN